MPPVYAVIIGIVALLIGGVIGVFSGIAYRKKVSEKEIGSAEEQAKKIVSDGEKQVETMKKEALLEAKEEILRQRNDADREIKDRRGEVARMERRLSQKEESLDKKTEQLEAKAEQLERSIKDNELAKAEIEKVLKQHLKTLEEISSISVEEAKDQLFKRVESET